MEKAVSLIQETLLENDPNLKGGEFTIELNKRVTVGKTRHEVDVYVVTRPGTSYEAIVLFECKDWKKPVSKNEVMHLKEKVELMGAARGVLVAPALTRDAEALLSEYRRIQYRRCSEDITAMFGIGVVHTIHDPFQITATITTLTAAKSLPADPKYCVCRWGDRIGFFQTLVHERVETIARMDQARRCHRYDCDCVHWHAVRERLEFVPGEFTLGTIELAAMHLDVCFFVEIVRQSPCYRCSIDGEGQVHSFEIVNDDFPHRRIEVNVVLVNGQSLESERKR